MGGGRLVGWEVVDWWGGRWLIGGVGGGYWWGGKWLIGGVGGG